MLTSVCLSVNSFTVDQEDVFYYGADHADLDHSPPFILSTFIAPTDIPPTGGTASMSFI